MRQIFFPLPRGPAAALFSLAISAFDTVVQDSVSHMDKEQAVQNVLYSNPSTGITCFMFPHAGFVNVLSQLGFNQNDGIINLMPIISYCDDE